MNWEVKKIFFPTDLSRHARHAYEFASNLADHYGASIAILHVLKESRGIIGIVYSGLLDEKKMGRAQKEK